MKAVGENEDLETKKTIEDHDGIVTQYKEIIREQARNFKLIFTRCIIHCFKPYMYVHSRNTQCILQ